MRKKTELTSLSILFSVLVSILLVTIVWGHMEERYLLQRMQLAHSQLEVLFGVAIYANRHLKEISNHVLHDHAEGVADIERTSHKLKTLLDSFDRLSAQEIDFVRSEETDEELQEREFIADLRVLNSRIETKIKLLAGFTNDEHGKQAERQVIAAIGELYEEKFIPLVEVQIEDERMEVERARAAAARKPVFITALSAVIALLSGLLSFLAVRLITKRLSWQLAEEEITYQTLHDGLTKLPNRRMFEQALNHTIDKMRLMEGEVAVLLIDLDEFKLINDTLGHASGDELLCQAAIRIKSAIRGSDLVARQGGDEFIVLASRFGSRVNEHKVEADAGIVANRILKKLQRPFQIGGREAYVSASIGISILPNDADNAAQLIQHADSAMYRAKELGRGNYQYFSKELSVRHKKRLSLATMLHKAIDEQEFVLNYQPIIDLSSGQMIGTEALIRWEHEKGHLISPADFLPVAEDTGLILEIGEWVIWEACRQLREWFDQGISLEVAVNLSARQMWHGDIAKRVLEIIKETGVSKDKLEFEITESAMVADPERMENTLRHFDESDIRISLDDFGTGYSSLSRLKLLPFSKLKIDKSFVDGIPADENDMAIVSATVQMARSLNLATLAEGIETEEQWRSLRKLGCSYGQGYYFSRPVGPSEIKRLYERGARWTLRDGA